MSFRLPMAVTSVDWSASGHNLAFGGRSRKTVSNSEECAQLIILNASGVYYVNRKNQLNKST